MIKHLAATLIAFGLAACTTAPLVTDNVVLEKTPDNIASENDASGYVIWGGVIVSANNLADRTQLEVLSYPLNNNQRPAIDKHPTGRFLIQSEGYLELASYAQGRLLTVLGSLQGVTQGTVGEAEYRYPTVTATDLHLWRSGTASQSGLVFGIGISIGD